MASSRDDVAAGKQQQHYSSDGDLQRESKSSIRLIARSCNRTLTVRSPQAFDSAPFSRLAARRRNADAGARRMVGDAKVDSICNPLLCGFDQTRGLINDGNSKK